MPGSESIFPDLVQTLLSWGALLVISLGVGALLWIAVRRLTERWRDDAKRLTERLDRLLTAREAELAQLRAEARPYPPDIGEPYQAPARALSGILETIATTLTAARDHLDASPALPNSVPVPLVPRIGHLLWHAPRAWHRRRAQLGAHHERVLNLEEPIAESQALLRQLRAKPWEVSLQARALRTTLEFTAELLANLRTAGLRGEPLTRMADAIASHSAEMATLPAYLLDAPEGQVTRHARPAAILQAWESLMGLRPAIYVCVDRLEAWQQAHTQTRHDLETLEQAVETAADCLAQAHPGLDVTVLQENWEAFKTKTNALTARFKTPTPEDFERLPQIQQLTREANQLIAQLAALEALRATLGETLTQQGAALDEVERQLRQLAGASRYPLDRVPFQAELDRLRLRLQALAETAAPRRPAELEADLAAAQILTRGVQGLVTRVTEAREDRRRLVALLDRDGAVNIDVTADVNWLAWARDLHERACPYASECWTNDHDQSIASLLDDAEALDARQRRWVPARVEDLLSPQTLARQAREVAALFDDVEALMDRLDQATRQLQRLQDAEETTRSDLEQVYGALDRLDIVAASILPAALSEEDNHWTRIREHLDEGYGLGLSLDNAGVGSVWEKAEHAERWASACQTTLKEWQQALRQEIKSALEALQADLDELAAVAPLNEEPAVQAARDTLARWQHLRVAGGKGNAEAAATACEALADEIADQLRALARLDKTAAALNTTLLAPLAGPVSRWREAESEADTAFGRLQRLELRSVQLWPPVSCDTAMVKAQLQLASDVRARLYQEGQRVADVIDILAQLTEGYQEITRMIETREAAYAALRPQLDGLLDRLDAWGADLRAYARRHAADPLVEAAVRARLDSIEAALNELQIQYDRSSDPIPGPEALRALETLWRQAHRDLPVGGGKDVIPADQIAR